jgi:GT2 family glycosyltransferase
MREVLPQADWIAFIDDDEIPEPGWLDELLRVGAEHGADVVAGPVEPEFEEQPPAWVLEGRFLARPRRETGTPLDRAGTGNVVVRTTVLRSGDAWFDEAMAMTGGSDILFFRRLHRQGCRIVWADQAVVRERVPATRATTSWICRRAFRYGCSTTRIELVLGPAAWAVPRVMILAGYKVLKGVLFALPAAGLRGRAGWVKYLRLVCYGVGMLYGLLGGRYKAYQTVDGG